MFNLKKKDNLKLVYRITLCILGIILSGVIGELFFNAPLLSGRQNKEIKINLENIESDGFIYKDGVMHTDGAIGADGSEKYISFNIKRQYVGKLHYKFQSQSNTPLRTKILVNYYSGYGSLKGNPLSHTKTINDNNNFFFNESVENIHETTDKITIVFPDVEQNIDITAIKINNTFNFSKKRMLFVCISIFLILYLIVGVDTFKHHIERAFVVCCVCIGGILCLSLPEHKVGWDEEIHFYRAYALSEKMMGHKTSVVYPAIDQLMKVTDGNWPMDMPRSKEEHREENIYFSSNGIYSASMLKDGSVPNKYIKSLPDSGLYRLGYIVQALFLSFAKLLRLPFSLVYLFGRFANLILYAFVMYFAIRKMPIGKHILTGLSLLPTLMFSSGIYTYDIVVYSFISLAVAYLLDEILNPERPMKYSSFALICFSMILGNAPKVVYIPLVLICLVLPNSKYRNSKEKHIFKGIVIFLFLAMLSTYVLPAATNSVEGDPRGVGETNVLEQLKLVLSHPVTYVQILLRSIIDTSGSYAFGREALGNMGHLDLVSFPILIPLYTFMLLLTDTQKDQNMQLKLKYRFANVLACFIAVALIWTALYLRFNGVGMISIEGVQGRYFLPLLPLLYLSVQSNKIENHIPENVYSRLVIGIPSFITMFSIYSLLIVKSV